MADKISKEDLHLDWSRPAVELTRVVRLGRAWTTFRGKRLTVLDAAPVPSERGSEHDATATATATADADTTVAPGSLDGPVVVTGGGRMVLRQVKPESRSPMSAEEWLRGVRPAVGERLGTD